MTEINLYSRSGTLLATGYVRVVKGGRGDYVEFHPDHIIRRNFHIPEDKLWRLSADWCDKIFYVECRSRDAANVKLYFQKRTVSYADYKVGMIYIAPADLFLGDGTPFTY